MPLHLLHGTETGTSEFLCDDLQEALNGEVDCAVASLSDISTSDLTGDELFVFVCSTFGSGELPFTAKPFVERLQAERRDLSTLRFAIFGLGDTAFGDTFNKGSETLEAALINCGAKPVADRGIFDSASGDEPINVALPWLRDVISAGG